MRIKKSWKVVMVSVVGLALIVGVALLSKAAMAGPTVLVYRSPA